MGCDRLGRERRAGRGGGGGVFGEAVLERVAAERTAGAGGEQRVVGFSRRVRAPRRCRTATVCLVSGVMRCLRPLPRQLTCAPVPSRMSLQVRPVSSEARSPVWAASRIMAWSRRPIQVARSGASSSASSSGSVRNVTSAWSWRLDGIARTRWIVAACSGCLSAAYLNSERIAARLRVAGADGVARVRARGGRGTRRSAARRDRRYPAWLGGLLVCCAANASSSRIVSR